MNLSKKSVLGLALGGAALVTSSYFTAKHYVEHKQLRSDLNSIPWDVPKEYSSWKRLFLQIQTNQTREYYPHPSLNMDLDTIRIDVS